MAKVKLDLKGRTDHEIITLARTMVTSMTGNPDYTTPNPPLASITAAADTGEAGINDALVKEQEAVEFVEKKDDAIEALSNLLTLSGNYIQLASGGDEAKILGAGVEVQSTGSPKAVPPKIENVKLTQGDDAGEVDIMWKSQVKLINNYSIRFTYGDINNPTWQNAPETPTKSKYTLSGLTSGAKVWVEVAGNNAAGKGGWSDPAVIYVP